MKMPAAGQVVEVLVDTSFVHRYLVETAKHVVPPQTLMRGTVVPTPSHMAGHLTMVNAVTGATNYISQHTILSINNEKIVKPEPTADKILLVKSSKGNETYTVRQNGVTKKWSCTCSGFVFKKNCRHVLEAQKK